MFRTGAGILAARAIAKPVAVAPRAHRQAVLALDDRGAIGFTGVLSTQDGLSISGGGHFNVSNLSADFCAQDGVSLGNGAVVNIFHGIASIGNGRWGWLKSGTADFNIKVGANVIATNTLAPVARSPRSERVRRSAITCRTAAPSPPARFAREHTLARRGTMIAPAAGPVQVEQTLA